MGIRGRLLLLVLSVALPLIVFGIFDLRNMWRLSRAQLDDSVRQQVELASVAFERWLIDQKNALQTVAALTGDNDTNSPAIRENLEHVFLTRPYWIDLRITNAAGSTMLVQPNRKSGLPPALSDHIVSEMRERNTWVVLTDRTVDDARPIVVIAVPIDKGGAVVARIDGNAISNLFNRIELPPEAVISVLAADGSVLFRRRGSESPTDIDALSKSMPFELGEARKLVVERTSPIDGVKRVYGVVRMTETGMLTVIGIPSAALYEPAQQRLSRYALTGLFALLIAVTAALVIERSIVIPVRRLRSAAQRLGAGDLTARAPVRGGGEMKDMGIVFNNMATQIAEREERLTHLDRLKSEFVSSVSHELKTPLTTIKVLAHLLQRPTTTAQEWRDYARAIAAECDRQIEFVGNLLDLSRIESGAYKLTKKPTEVGELIRSCVEVERHRAEANGLSITEDAPFDLPLVQGEPDALRRVIRGLIDNAIKYTPEGGRINVNGSASASNSVVTVTVSDNGPGISSSDLPHVFEKFYRAASERTDIEEDPTSSGGAAPGVGLGLYLARHIIEQLGGEIRIESEEGRGTIVTVTLRRWTNGDEAETPKQEDPLVEASVSS